MATWEDMVTEYEQYFYNLKFLLLVVHIFIIKHVSSSFQFLKAQSHTR